MASPIVINALLQRKAELLADAEKVCDQLDAIYEDINHLDVSLALLGHTGTGRTFPKRKRPAEMFYQGELTRLLFDHLRSAGPQTFVQIRDALIDLKGADRGDLRIRRSVHKKVIIALRRQEKRGTMVRDGEAWRVA